MSNTLKFPLLTRPSIATRSRFPENVIEMFFNGVNLRGVTVPISYSVESRRRLVLLLSLRTMPLTTSGTPTEGILLWLTAMTNQGRVASLLTACFRFFVACHGHLRSSLSRDVQAVARFFEFLSV